METPPSGRSLASARERSAKPSRFIRVWEACAYVQGFGLKASAVVHSAAFQLPDQSQTGKHMTKLIDLFAWLLGLRHVDWREHNGYMRRWRGGRWETRPMTEAEAVEDAWWQAIR